MCHGIVILSWLGCLVYLRCLARKSAPQVFITVTVIVVLPRRKWAQRLCFMGEKTKGTQGGQYRLVFQNISLYHRGNYWISQTCAFWNVMSASWIHCNDGYTIPPSPVCVCKSLWPNLFFPVSHQDHLFLINFRIFRANGRKVFDGKAKLRQDSSPGNNTEQKENTSSLRHQNLGWEMGATEQTANNSWSSITRRKEMFNLDWPSALWCNMITGANKSPPTH